MIVGGILLKHFFKSYKNNFLATVHQTGWPIMAFDNLLILLPPKTWHSFCERERSSWPIRKGQESGFPSETGKPEQQSRPLMCDAFVDTEVIKVLGSFCPDSTPSIEPRLAPSRQGFRGDACVRPSLRKSENREGGKWMVRAQAYLSCLIYPWAAPGGEGEWTIMWRLWEWMFDFFPLPKCWKNKLN